MSRPKCYIESPLGFEPTRSAEYEGFLEQIRKYAEPINPFFIAGEEFIPEITRLTGQEKQERWCDMAVRLYEVIEKEADMGFAILNGEPADIGVGCEMAFGYALHKVGFKKFPIVAYREDFRRAGETENNLNAMLLPPYMRTGGEFISTYPEIQPAIGRVALSIAAK